MALINCPACNKRVSSRAKTCPHCNAPIALVDDEATTRALARSRWIKRKRMQNISFVAILSFTVGVGLFWYHRENQSSWQFTVGLWLLVGGFAGYAILRIKQIIERFT